MINLRRIAILGNHLPRQCGIATFTHDLHAAVRAARPALDTAVVAITGAGTSHDYPPCVNFEIRENVLGDYSRSAISMAATDTDLVCLQHEYGIFGGIAGSHILEFLDHSTIPVVTTLHTVLAEPTLAQRRTIERVIDRSTKLIVMADRARALLQTVHNVPDSKIEVIPHGIHDRPLCSPDDGKTALGYEGKKVILTFGLLSPNKGIETMLDAMPRILQASPGAVYIVLGATHPSLLREHGEAYRDLLLAHAQTLGIENHVVFVNQFVDQATLLDYIAMCDVYVTPYANEAQMTSGTLAYSFGMGASVVSTPYWHATELLRDNLGILVPFADAETMGREIAGLLTDPTRRQAIRARAYAASRSMTWPETAKRYLEVFDRACAVVRSAEPKPPRGLQAAFDSSALPDVEIDHFLSFCDDTGMLQHGHYGVAAREHGYCLDDNARALLLVSALARQGDTRIPGAASAPLMAFVRHAWNPDTSRFRNFMSFDRRWLEDTGSEDSHGRALWALGDHVRSSAEATHVTWAVALFAKSFPQATSFTSPRAWAFTLLGLNAWCSAVVGDLQARRLRQSLAERLMSLIQEADNGEWVWFEDVLAYDNARLPQALIQTGLATGCDAYVTAGLRTLSWLMTRQTSPAGHFRPVGSDSFGAARAMPKPFDQQPLEAAAAISACLAAWSATGDMAWRARAITAFRWFIGHNDLAISLADPRTGGCADGLHPHGRNENMGAESTLSYLLGLAELRAMTQSAVTRDRAESRLGRG